MNRPTPALEQEVLNRLVAMEQGVADVEHAQRLATVGLLTAGIAHEINNLLTPALGYSQLAKTRADDPELQARALDRIADAVASSCQILSAILEFASPGTGAIADAGADIADVVAEATLCLESEMRRGRVELDVDVEEGVRTLLDPLSLRQVLINLVLNACHALAPHGGRVEIRLAVAASGRLRLEVSDNGPGVPANERDRIFEPFVRGGSPEPHKGSGLGLAVCRRVLEAAGGSISVQESRDGGATFAMDLPAADRPILSR